MATKDEILKQIKDATENSTQIAMFYTFDEGSEIKLNRPQNQNLEEIDEQLVSLLVAGITDKTAFQFASLLYFRTFAELSPEQFAAVKGSVFVDKNLYSEDNRENAKTTASAAFVKSSNDVYIRENFLSGEASVQATDMINILHETRHYLQHIQNPSFVRHIGKPDEGSMSQHDMFVLAFKGFGIETLFPGASKEEISDISYAVYHQNPIEKDARAYSMEVARDLIARALNSENLPEDRIECLSSMLRTVDEELAREIVDNAQYGAKFANVTDVVMQKADQVLAEKDTVLSPENIAKLEHYSERCVETEDIRQYIFDVENALLVRYDQPTAEKIEDIILTHDIYAIGRKLVQNPNHQPKPETVDKIVQGEMFLCFGINNLPIFPLEELVDRYATLNATQEE